MNLQNTFYVLGIIFMSLNILILLGIVFLLFFIKSKVADMHKMVTEKIEEITSKPVTIAANVGAAMADSAINKVKSMMKKS